MTAKKPLFSSFLVLTAILGVKVTLFITGILRFTEQFLDLIVNNFAFR